jgi:hypothetical protein
MGRQAWVVQTDDQQMKQTEPRVGGPGNPSTEAAN